MILHFRNKEVQVHVDYVGPTHQFFFFDSLSLLLASSIAVMQELHAAFSVSLPSAGTKCFIFNVLHPLCVQLAISHLAINIAGCPLCY